MTRIAIIVSTVGYHWEELFSAYWVFRDAGWNIELYTVDGKAARVDPSSLKPTGPAALMGLGMSKSIAPETSRGQILTAELAKIQPLDALNPEQIDTLYLPGGHGCLFDVNRNASLHAIIARLHERGCLLSGVCHATSTFALTQMGGCSIAEGHKLTGFPHALDRMLIAAGWVRSEFLPLPLINDTELKRAGVKHTVVDEALALLNPRHMCMSLPFITGMGPKSAAPVAKALVKALKKAEAPRRTMAKAAAT